MRELSLLEARVLGVLVEKERVVPDAYPLSLNALVAGCNQKTSRSPILDAAESDVRAAVESLKGLSLVIESSGGRVMRYAQNVRRVLQVPGESVALLAMLMLRGPQTAAELRANCERVCRFSDVSAVEGFLSELAARGAGALVQELPRQPGARENRWMHCLSGASAPPQPGTTAAPAPTLQVDLPDVVAEVRALLQAYAQARAAGDLQALGRFLWQSPRAVLYDRGRMLGGSEEVERQLSRADAAFGPLAAQPSGGQDVRLQVRTFGRDLASTGVEMPPTGAAPSRCESQTWIRLPQGWRIVASHASERAPAE